MVNLSYQLSETINENVRLVESLRIKVLTSPVSPRSEIRLRWEANINKTYWGLNLAKNPLTKIQISKLMSSTLPKKLKDKEKEVVCYMNCLNLIREYWTGSKNNLNTKNILDIYDLSCKPIFGSTTNYYKSKEEEVKKIINFIDSGKDHPVIKAGLLQIEIIKLSPFENGTGRVARLLSHLLLSKYGYDLRGLLVLEDYYRSDLVSLKEATKSIEKDKNATKWLEYFTEGVKTGTERVLKVVTSANTETTISKSWRLTDRQRKIIQVLEKPDAKITNKNVQKIFGVSTITASRDLSKMVNLGILLAHGKGRSVAYTKI